MFQLMYAMSVFFFFFFFQAEDGIRDLTVTGVQTCALPILAPRHLLESRVREAHRVEHPPAELGDARRRVPLSPLRGHGFRDDPPQGVEVDDPVDLAAERRRPGGEEHGILEGRAEEADGGGGGGGGGSRRAHGASSSVGPRPETGGLTVAETASSAERSSRPRAPASESSAAA